MNAPELKTKMMKLWKSIFHDSDAYISLVFDNYFDPEFVEYYEEGGKLVSALMGVPYYFGNDRQRTKAIYLCGLATLEEFRHRGIMNDLLNKANSKAKEKGYSLSFLIPATDMLRIYYSSKGYVNGMYSVEDRYTSVHDFANDYRVILSGEDERINKLKTKYFEGLKVERLDNKDADGLKRALEYIVESESDNLHYFVLQHSSKDLEAAIEENAISGGAVFSCHNDDGKITGIAFVVPDGYGKIRIPKIYHKDNCTYYRLLDEIKKSYPDSSMGVVCYPEETDRKALWSKVYGASNPDASLGAGAYGVAERVFDVAQHAKPYGMVKILDVHEILKFLAADRIDCKFSILVKDVDSGMSAVKFDVDGGKVKFQEIDADRVDEFSFKPGVTVLSLQGLAEILFRKIDSSNVIMEAFGIPRLSLNMSLLLD